jgi:hypothetical protein
MIRQQEDVLEATGGEQNGIPTIPGVNLRYLQRLRWDWQSERRSGGMMTAN